MWQSLAGYTPDLDALRATPARVVIGIGTTSEGQFAYRTAVLLAELLGLRPVVVPGDHGGMFGTPWEFTARLLEVLAAQNGRAARAADVHRGWRCHGANASPSLNSGSAKARCFYPDLGRGAVAADTCGDVGEAVRLRPIGISVSRPRQWRRAGTRSLPR
jgi:hypothetical protein